MISGMIIVLIALFNTKGMRIFRIGGSLLGIIALFWTIQTVLNSNGTDPFNIPLGIMCMCLTCGFLFQNAEYSRFKSTGTWIGLAWLTAAYGTFMPTLRTTFESALSWLPWMIIGFLILYEGLDLVRYLFVPDLWHLKDYYLHQSARETNRSNKGDAL